MDDACRGETQLIDRIGIGGQILSGGSGLGRALALALAADGVEVFVWARRMEALVATAELAAGLDGTIHPVRGDVTDPEQIDAAIAASTTADGVPGMLVNNAAGAYVKFADQISTEGWREVLASSLDGVFLTSKAGCRARVVSARGGVVLNVTSATIGTGRVYVVPADGLRDCADHVV